MAQQLVIPPLNGAQSRILSVITKGGRMEAHRMYPFPRKYKLFSKTGKEYAAKVPEGTVASLLELNLIRAVQLDDAADRIDYYTTTLGVRAMKNHTALAKPDETQLELIEQAADLRESA